MPDPADRRLEADLERLVATTASARAIGRTLDAVAREVERGDRLTRLVRSIGRRLDEISAALPVVATSALALRGRSNALQVVDAAGNRIRVHVARADDATFSVSGHVTGPDGSARRAHVLVASADDADPRVVECDDAGVFDVDDLVDPPTTCAVEVNDGSWVLVPPLDATDDR